MKSRWLLLLGILSFLSCKRVIKPAPVIDPHWHKLTLRHGWIMFAPEGFVSEPRQGIDSEPGIIYSRKDSLAFLYDTGLPNFKVPSDCNFDKNYKEERKKINAGFYKSLHDKSKFDTVYIDTVDNKIAIIFKPVKAGKGATGIEINDCDKPWIGMQATNLSEQKEMLVLKMAKTLKLVE